MNRIEPAFSRPRIPYAIFDQYLRTGTWRRPAAREPAIEVKFNPWHDPQTGRFTSRGGGPPGSWTGGGFTGGGGGSTGGAGASFDGGGSSGSWSADTRPKTKPATKASSALTQAVRIATTPGQGSTPWHSIERNGYTYQLDAADRTRQVTGTLTLNPDQARSRTAQAQAGGADRLPTDQGGHYIARRFNGPTDAFNHFAQDADFNRGDYLTLERGWAKDMRAGKKVYVKIKPEYSGGSQRPDNIVVRYTVDGQPRNRIFSNASKRKSHGK
jgi:hypothetical protein